MAEAARAGLIPAGTRRLGAGEALFREGDPATAIFRVVSGGVHLERSGRNGERVILHKARPGEFFAEAALFSTIYHCDAITGVPSDIEVYGKAAILATLRDDAAAAERFMALLARTLQTTRRRLELRNIRSARERLLLWIADGGPEGLLVEGHLQDLAAELGLTREAFYRTLKALEAEGAIARRGRRITLVSPANV